MIRREKRQVLGGNSNRGMDYCCLPPIQFESEVKDFLSPLRRAFSPNPWRMTVNFLNFFSLRTWDTVQASCFPEVCFLDRVSTGSEPCNLCCSLWGEK